MSLRAPTTLALPRSAAAWGSGSFPAVFCAEVGALSPAGLPLQAGLAHSSHVDEAAGHQVILLGSGEEDSAIIVRAGIVYGGLVAGSCCADDPTPLDTRSEYCELEFRIDRRNGATRVRLLPG